MKALAISETPIATLLLKFQLWTHALCSLEPILVPKDHIVECCLSFRLSAISCFQASRPSRQHPSICHSRRCGCVQQHVSSIIEHFRMLLRKGFSSFADLNACTHSSLESSASRCLGFSTQALLYQSCMARVELVCTSPDGAAPSLQVTDVDYTYPEAFPAVAKDLVDKLLVVDPDERL
eukprot:scaffold199754_cov15-Tisochrysis_lutea.AAC.1